jgi:hypothetical protein
LSLTLDRVGRRRYAPARKNDAAAKPPAERLRLTVRDSRTSYGIPTTWEDEKDTLLEDRLTDIVTGLAVIAELTCREAISARLRREQEQREEAQRQERARLAKLEQERLDALISEASAWRRAQELREYVAAVMNSRCLRDDRAVEQRLEAWATWAFSEADRLDPIASASAGHIPSIPTLTLKKED